MRKLVFIIIPILLLASCKTPNKVDETTTSVEVSTTTPNETIPTTNTDTNNATSNEISTPKDGEITWETTIHW